MNCPDCLTPDMTKEDASACTDDLAGTVVPAALAAIKKERPSVVAAVYFCSDCGVYFRWELGVPGLLRMRTGTKVGTQADDDYIDPSVITTRVINQEAAR